MKNKIYIFQFSANDPLHTTSSLDIFISKQNKKKISLYIKKHNAFCRYFLDFGNLWETREVTVCFLLHLIVKSTFFWFTDWTEFRFSDHILHGGLIQWTLNSVLLS